VLVGIAAFFSVRLRSQAAASPTSIPASALAVATRLPTRTPIFPTPTLEPTPTPVVLQIGASAQVVNTEGTLRGRKQPSLKAAAIAAFKAGERVHILEGPIEAGIYLVEDRRGQRQWLERPAIERRRRLASAGRAVMKVYAVQVRLARM